MKLSRSQSPDHPPALLLPDIPRVSHRRGAAEDSCRSGGGNARRPAGHCRSVFDFLASTAADTEALHGLGTYGFIRGASAFIVGAAAPGEGWLEDYGYAMEELVLLATDLGLGTCWLGGSFTRSSFSRAIGAGPGSGCPRLPRSAWCRTWRVPETGSFAGAWAVISGCRGRSIFSNERFGVPLTPEAAGPFSTPLEMVRLGPVGIEQAAVADRPGRRVMAFLPPAHPGIFRRPGRQAPQGGGYPARGYRHRDVSLRAHCPGARAPRGLGGPRTAHRNNGTARRIRRDLGAASGA